MDDEIAHLGIVDGLARLAQPGIVGIGIIGIEAHLKGTISWPGAGYFGDRPTFDTGRTFLEVYLIGFDGDLYGRTMQVEFIDVIRPDRRFGSIAELVAQMRIDCTDTLNKLDALKAENPVAGFPLGKLQSEGLI